MKKFVFLPTLLIGFCILISCSNSPSHTFTRALNENNIEIITNSGRPKFSGPLYTIRETLSLGGEEPEPQLYKPFGVLADDEGFLFFADEQRIKKFSSQGKFIGLISQPGQGPGEINFPMLAAIFGDTLYVDQYRWTGQRKYELFSTNGEHLGKMPFPRIKHSKEQQSAVIKKPVGSERFLFSFQHTAETANAALNEMKYGIADSEGNILKMLDLKIEPFASFIIKDTGGTLAPFVVGAREYISDNIYILSGIGNRIDQFSLNGELRRTIHLDLQREPVTKSDIAMILEKNKRPEFPSILESSDFPKMKPVASSLITDDRGRLWVKKGADYYSELAGQATYMIFSADGEYLADQTFPCDITIIQNSMAYGFVHNDEGLAIFKTFELIEL